MTCGLLWDRSDSRPDRSPSLCKRIFIAPGRSNALDFPPVETWSRVDVVREERETSPGIKMEHEETRPETNPETEEKTYPWMDAKGNALNANGSVVECDCDRCLAKYEIRGGVR